MLWVALRSTQATFSAPSLRMAQGKGAPRSRPARLSVLVNIQGRKRAHDLHRLQADRDYAQEQFERVARLCIVSIAQLFASLTMFQSRSFHALALDHPVQRRLAVDDIVQGLQRNAGDATRQSSPTVEAPEFTARVCSPRSFGALRRLIPAADAGAANSRSRLRKGCLRQGRSNGCICPRRRLRDGHR
jgi:hypothetical protein